MDNAIECRQLGRVYSSRQITGGKREVVALSNLDLEIPAGMVFGLLGPNGAGKTTTVRILATLLTPTSGQAWVLGHDVVRHASRVRERIGLILGGDRGLYGRLTGRENLKYFGALNHMSPSVASRRANDLLGQLGIADAANRRVDQYSRGMKQRLHIARGLLPDPEVPFMDEPTLGMDPVGSQEVRQLVPELARQGKTVLLTTHYMFEADQLCERVALIDKGEVVASGTPADIKGKFSKISVVEVIINAPRADLISALLGLDGVLHASSGSDGPFMKVVLHTHLNANVIDQVTEVAGAGNVESIIEREPTLEEAYISILR